MGSRTPGTNGSRTSTSRRDEISLQSSSTTHGMNRSRTSTSHSDGISHPLPSTYHSTDRSRTRTSPSHSDGISHPLPSTYHGADRSRTSTSHSDGISHLLPSTTHGLPSSNSDPTHHIASQLAAMWPTGNTHTASILHTAKLPNMNQTLNIALASLDTNLPSPWARPVEWIYVDLNYLRTIANSLALLVGDPEPMERDRTASSFVPLNMIYPRLITYVSVHLKYCTRNENVWRRFREALQQWRAWDIITMIEHYQVIKDYLADVFQDHLQSDVSHPNSTFIELLYHDNIRLFAQLAALVIDNNMCHELVARRNQGAQVLLDLLQMRLDRHMHPAHRARHFKVLSKLSSASGRFPECLVLKGIEIEGHPVARGGYGDVYVGLLYGKMKIAVKTLRIYQDSDITELLKGFSAEAILWRQLSHPNVLPFYGVFYMEGGPRRLCLTAPWMENGNVVDFIKQYPNTDGILLMLDIAQGVEYLHSLQPSIIHGDLKGVNVLITPSRRACIADFGLATVKDSKTLIMSHNSTARAGGTMRWLAPELLSPDDSQHTSKTSDIYAFACVCYEIFSGEVPFYKDSNEIRVILGVMQGKRPAQPSHSLSRVRGMSDVVWLLIDACWAQDPMKRPSANDIIERLLDGLPYLSEDGRPLDEFDTGLPSQTSLDNFARNPSPRLSIAPMHPSSFIPAPVRSQVSDHKFDGFRRTTQSKVAPGST